MDGYDEMFELRPGVSGTLVGAIFAREAKRSDSRCVRFLLPTQQLGLVLLLCPQSAVANIAILLALEARPC